MHKVDHWAVASPQRLVIPSQGAIAMSAKTLGIDVAKAKFDVALLRPGHKPRCAAFSNDRQGFRALWAWLARHNARQGVWACLEATGRYGLELAHFLHQAAVPVSVVNPACIKAFAQAELRRTKTDGVDAQVIAHFCRALEPAAWQPPAPEVAELQALARRLEDLQAMCGEDRNRLQDPGTPQAVQASLREVLAVLEQQIVGIKRQMADHIRRHPSLQAQLELLRSIPGIGFITAVVLLGEIGALTRFRSARQLAAYAGVVPCHRLSGASLRGRSRMSKRGNARLRKALYWPAIVAMRHNPLLRAFAQRLRAAGKPTLVIIGAVMRKLLHQVFGILRSGQPFDPNHRSATLCSA
jgi:transposase